MATVLLCLAALTTGFLAGLLTFKRSTRWCPGCGAVLRCLECPGHPAPVQVLTAAGRRTRPQVRR